MTNPELAQDPEAFLAHLDAQINELIRYSARLDSATGAGEATDPTGTVKVAFKPGQGLESITVVKDWEQHVSASELSTVVTETLIRARDGEGTPTQGEELSDAEANAIREREEEQWRKVFEETSVEDDDVDIERLSEKFEELNASLEKMVMRSSEFETEISEVPIEIESQTVYSENRMLWIDHINGSPTRVSFHQSWLSGKTGVILNKIFEEAVFALSQYNAER